MKPRPPHASCDPEKCFYGEQCSKFSDAVNGISLSECAVGDRGKVRFVCPTEKALCQKLTSMGIVQGAEIRVLATAPFGDPIMIEVGAVRMALRREEASAIEMYPLES